MDENKRIDADKLMAHFDGLGGYHAENISNLSPVDEFICSECGLTLRDYCRYDKEEDAYYGYELKYCPECGAYIDRP